MVTQQLIHDIHNSVPSSKDMETTKGNEALINAGRMKLEVIMPSQRYQTQKPYAVQKFTQVYNRQTGRNWLPEVLVRDGG